MHQKLLLLKVVDVALFVMQDLENEIEDVNSHFR